MPERVMVFLDYQNVYQGARHTFGFDGSPFWHGQFRPDLLGEHLAADSPRDRDLVQVRIYRGMPAYSADPKGNLACRRQQTSWRQSSKIKVINRPLKYPPGWPTSHAIGERPSEKSVDVALAVDFATMAGIAYDVGIIFSTDNDLLPALEYVASLTAVGRSPLPRAEVAAWTSPKQYHPRLSIKERRLYCHWVDRVTYDGMADLTDYTKR
jgi:uncharacterized LabA/DUF88 family protein